jgi:glutathione S-transferase
MHSIHMIYVLNHTESRAIAQYIATKYRSQGTDLYPNETDLKAFALFQQV